MQNEALKFFAAAIGVVVLLASVMYFAGGTKDKADDMDDKYENKSTEVFGRLDIPTPQNRMNEMGVYLKA